LHETRRKKLNLRYILIELNTIFELDDFEDFLGPKNDILRTIYAIIYTTDYAAHFKINIRINGHSI
jgi:hypothetical protein